MKRARTGLYVLIFRSIFEDYVNDVDYKRRRRRLHGSGFVPENRTSANKPTPCSTLDFRHTVCILVVDMEKPRSANPNEYTPHVIAGGRRVRVGVVRGCLRETRLLYLGLCELCDLMKVRVNVCECVFVMMTADVCMIAKQKLHSGIQFEF